MLTLRCRAAVLLLGVGTAALLATGPAQAAPAGADEATPAAPAPSSDTAPGSRTQSDDATPAAVSRSDDAARAEPSRSDDAAPAQARSSDATKTASARSTYADDIFTGTNAEREAAGCDPLEIDDRLTAAAQAHSEDMADHGEMTHVGSDGSTFDQRIRDEGHPKPGAENIARRYPDGATTVREWMDSPGHRRNILNCTYVTVGVGYDPRGNYVTQDFGRPE